MLMGLGLPQSEIGHLLGKGGQLGHPLLGGNKLGGHIPVWLDLFDEAVLALLLLVKEPGFLPAVSDKRLKKMMVRTQKYIKKEESKRKG